MRSCVGGCLIQFNYASQTRHGPRQQRRDRECARGRARVASSRRRIELSGVDGFFNAKLWRIGNCAWLPHSRRAERKVRAFVANCHRCTLIWRCVPRRPPIRFGHSFGRCQRAANERKAAKLLRNRRAPSKWLRNHYSGPFDCYQSHAHTLAFDGERQCSARAWWRDAIRAPATHWWLCATAENQNSDSMP